MIAKSTTIKDRGGKSGGRAAKAVGLTSGGLRCVSATGLRSPQGGLTAVQKSADGKVGHGVGEVSEALRTERRRNGEAEPEAVTEGPNGGRG
jgi:hypothetical protein